MIKKRKERKGVGGDTKDTSKQVHQITMATKECGLKFMSPLFQQRGSKWPPSGLTESMHLSECCGWLFEKALGIETEENHSNFVSPSLPRPSQAKTLVSEGTTLSFPEPVQTKPCRIQALSHPPVAEKSSYVPYCLKSKDQSAGNQLGTLLCSLLNPPMFSRQDKRLPWFPGKLARMLKF